MEISWRLITEMMLSFGRRIGAFICYRQQRIVINDVKSDLAPVVSGAPQGTVLGPLLLSLHINDITSDIESEIRLFADGSVCYHDADDEQTD